MRTNRIHTILSLLAVLCLLLTGCGKGKPAVDASVETTQATESAETSGMSEEQETVPTANWDLGGETIPDVPQTQSPEEENTISETTAEATEPQETEAPPATKPPSWGDVWDVPGESF